MKAWLMYTTQSKLYLVFGEDCVKASKILAKKLKCNYKDFSVGKSWNVDEKEPLNLSCLWPYFTAFPPEKHTNNE